MNTWLAQKSSLLLVGLAVIFFFVYSWLALEQPLKFNSPDETANYFFIKLYAETGQLAYPEPLEVVAENIIHPRGVNVAHGNIVPGSFLGMILLYGWIAKIFGIAIIPFLTPFFAVIAVLAFYGLIKRIFPSTSSGNNKVSGGSQIALYSSLLLFILPPFWYYASRGLMPNVLFVSLLIIGFFWLVRLEPRYILAGLFIGGALIVRTAEIGWVGLILLILWWHYRRKIKFYQIILFLAVIVLAFLPIFYHQQILYGAPLSVGYNRIGVQNESFAENGSSSRLTLRFQGETSWAAVIAPFGFHPVIAAINFYKYYLWLFWYLAIPAILGFILAVKKRLIVDSYLLIVGLASLWLIIYYGSWAYQNLIDPAAVGLASSHVRYWLPIYISFLPLIVIAIASVKKKMLCVMCYVLCGVLGSLMSLTALAQDRQNIVEYRSTADNIIQKTEENSVILTERSDKIFFPERRVIALEKAEEEKIFRVLGKLVEVLPVYYYTDLAEKDIEYLNEKKLSIRGLGFRGTERAGLYKLEKTVKKTEGRGVEPVINPQLKLKSKTKHYLDIPFTVQAPYADWRLPYKELCEEASTLMVAKYFQGESLTPYLANQELLRIIEFENKEFGDYQDTDTEETAELLQEYFRLKAEVVYDFDITDIEQAIDAGQPVIIPAAGRLLGNPYFRQPGPLYHMLVIKGYDNGEFITNDPGTKHGENFRYQYETILNAAHDWNGGDIMNGRRAMIVVKE